MNFSRIFRAYIVPSAVYQSVAIAGGYGTGREIVEYFTRHGAYGGLVGLATVTVLLAVITGVTFEFARQFGARDYRTFFKRLIGPFWILFEVVYITLFLLVLAIIASAAGAMLAESFGISQRIGLLAMLGTIAVLTFYGRELIARVMVFWTAVLYLVFVTFFALALSTNAEQIQSQFAVASLESGWFVSALKFALYSSAIAVVALFATSGIKTRTEAFGAGALCAIVSMVPALLFHVSFVGELPQILDQQVPVFWMIGTLGMPMFTYIYSLVLFGTFIETGAGFIQTVNERLDQWSFERRNKALPRWLHSGVAVGGLLGSAALAQLGIIALVAKGYGTIAWTFLIIYIIPIMTIGIYKIVRNGTEIKAG